RQSRGAPDAGGDRERRDAGGGGPHAVGAGGRLLPARAHARGAGDRPGGALPSRQWRAAGTHQSARRPFAGGDAAIPVPDGQLPVRSRRHRGESRGVRQSRRGDGVRGGEEAGGGVCGQGVTLPPLWRVLQRNDADAADLAALPFATEHEKKLLPPLCEARTAKPVTASFDATTWPFSGGWRDRIDRTASRVLCTTCAPRPVHSSGEP